MSGNFYDQRDIARWSANGRAATRLAAKSTGFAILADRPSHIERNGGLSGVEQVLATVLTLLMLILTGVLWNLVPLAGALMSLLGIYFMARRVAAFSSTPLRVRGLFRALGTRRADSDETVVPSWYWVVSLSLIGFATLHRSVILEWIPEWMRSGSYYGASLAIIINFGIAVWAGRQAVRQNRQALADQAETQASIASMLGGNPRALFEPSPQTGMVAADWNYLRDGRITVTPQADVDLPGVEARLERTRLGQRFEVEHADYEQIILAPISDETLTRIRHRQQSGGLVEGQEDLAGVPSSGTSIALDLDDDDPFGAVETPSSDPAANAAGDDGIPTFSEEDWR